MAIKPIEEKDGEKSALLRVTIPKKLLHEIRETKKLCREYGYAFDIKPDVREALERAVFEAKKTVEKAKKEGATRREVEPEAED
ncbi:MAG: hypothetical protein JRI97_04265 [Deltaproteobacteria bacterium]|nr:hypothetical protein [Deltaproteobacteria bacterium]